jgi:hypothetical protein
MKQKIKIEIAVGLVAAVALAVGLFIWTSSQKIQTDVLVMQVSKKAESEQGILTVDKTANWQVFDQYKEGVAAVILPNFEFPKNWHTGNMAGDSEVNMIFSDGGNKVGSKVDIIDPSTNECRFSVLFRGSDGSYETSKTNSKKTVVDKNDCDLIIAQLEKQIPNTSSEIAAWKTYTSDKYGFQLQYPNGWFAYTDNASDVFFQSSKEISGGIPGPHSDAFEIKSIPSKESLDSFIASLEKQAGIIYDKVAVKIGDLDGIKAVSNCEGSGCGAPEWFAARNGIVYHFSTNLGYENNQRNFDQILSTFKFTK